MKKTIGISGLYGLMLMFVVGATHAYELTLSPVQDYTNWSVEPAEGRIQLSMAGADSWSGVSTDLTGDAFYAQITVESADCSGFCMARLYRNVGKLGNQDVRVEIRLSAWEGSRVVEYTVRLIDDSGNFTDYMRGRFSGLSGIHWDVGNPVGVAVGIEGQDLVFYSDTRNVIHKIDMNGQLVPYETPEAYGMFVYTQDEGDSVTASFRGFLDVTLE